MGAPKIGDRVENMHPKGPRWIGTVRGVRCVGSLVIICVEINQTVEDGQWLISCDDDGLEHWVKTEKIRPL